MTDLRDARLRRALDHAPDAAFVPSEATRVAIKTIAFEAGAAAASVSAKATPQATIWRRVVGWWSSPSIGSRHMPWNAALATVVLASLVTLMWFDQPARQAVPEEVPSRAAGQVRDDTPTSAGAPPAAAVAAPQTTPLRDTSPSAPGAERAGASPRQPAPAKPAPLAKAAGATTEAKVETARAIVSVPISRELESRQVAEANQSTGSGIPPVETMVVTPRAAVPVRSEAAAAARMPAAAPATARVFPEPSESRVSLADKEKQKRHADIGLADATPAVAPTSSAAWSDLSVRRAGSSQVLSSAQASRLVALVQAVVQSAVPSGEREPTGAIRLELTRRGELVATIDLADRWLRWAPVGADSRGALFARMSAAQWEAIQNELTRLGLRAP
jgi:hypothetical protein